MSGQWTGPCPHCGAVALDEWPHPERSPCPLALDAHQREQERRRLANEAYVEMLQAQRDYYTRAQMPLLDMGEAMRSISREIGGEE